MVTAYVDSPSNRLIYINGNYGQNAGNSNGSFSLNPGAYLFETRDGDNRIDYRKRFRVTRKDKTVRISLERV